MRTIIPALVSVTVIAAGCASAGPRNIENPNTYILAVRSQKSVAEVHKCARRLARYAYAKNDAVQTSQFGSSSSVETVAMAYGRGTVSNGVSYGVSREGDATVLHVLPARALLPRAEEARAIPTQSRSLRPVRPAQWRTWLHRHVRDHSLLVIPPRDDTLGVAPIVERSS